MILLNVCSSRLICCANLKLINADIVRYRSLFQNVIFQSFDFSAKHAVEDVLWETHGRINKQFRRRLKYVGLTAINSSGAGDTDLSY